MSLVIVNLLFVMCICPSHLVFLFYVCLKLTINIISILGDNEGKKFRKQFMVSDVWFLSSNEMIIVN